MIISNIVKKDKLREVQSETLENLKDALIESFGPMGSTTIMSKDGRFNEYTKDGHNILKNIHYVYPIEESVRKDLEDITRHIVKNVGDGTTSSVMLSHFIFEELKKMETNMPPYAISRQFKETVNKVKELILENAHEFTAQTAYDITFTSTNGNTEIAENIREIYTNFGKDVFIDVGVSNNENSYTKTYDGMTIETGYSDNAFINNSSKGIASLRSPEIYSFVDPIDTPEMISFVDRILEHNIMSAYSQGASRAPIPTVILAPKISRDMSTYLAKLMEFMFGFEDETTKPPLIIITNIYQSSQFSDVARMCGCKPIRKYINPDIQMKDIEDGLAPTMDSIFSFAGCSDIVEADLSKTKFVNPKLMYNTDGEPTREFSGLVKFLESELEKAYEEKQDANTTGGLKRRINSLKANMIEYLVGGVSVSDRDSLRDLVEDSVLNCRSASKHGFGRGANFEALSVLHKIENKNKMEEILFKAYYNLLSTLYSTALPYDDVAIEIECSFIEDEPLNIRTNEYDGTVICSIHTDVVILEGIAQILTLMFASNQFLTNTALDNRYLQK